MEKKKTVPEVETVTITMSRPVAEAVKTACEWYLRLHMGQFWDMADDLCMEKFYSDLENNVYETNEQRENAFDVALHRRDTMREEMEKLYNRCVLPAPISDVMKIPYFTNNSVQSGNCMAGHSTRAVVARQPGRCCRVRQLLCAVEPQRPAAAENRAETERQR
mgnify:CR=1 FL=1